MNLLQSPVFWFVMAVIVVVAAVAVKRRNSATQRLDDVVKNADGRYSAAWGFKDVVKNPEARSRVEDAYKEADAAVQRAARWNDAQVARAAREFILDATSSRDAWVEARILKSFGSRTHPIVLELLCDPKLYARLVRPTGVDILPEAPFNRACNLLGDAPPSAAVEALAPFLDDESNRIRKDAALAIAETGDSTIGPHVRKAFSDADDYVRSYALMGLGRALNRSGIAETLSRELYPDVLALLREGKNADKAADILFRLDRDRAKECFLSPEAFTADSPILHEVLKTLAKDKVPVSPERLLELIESLEGKELKYPCDYALGEALCLLGQQQRAEDRDLLRVRASHPNEEVARGAASGLLSSFGLDGFEQKIWGVDSLSEFEALSDHQRFYSAVFTCDAEINNGGLAQYFVNSSGDHWRDAVAGLKAMGFKERLGILNEAIALFGGDGPSTDRSARQEQLSKLYRRDDAIFEELETRYYKSSEVVDVLAAQYVLANAEGFR